MVSVILDNVAAGIPRADLLRSYPSITDADIDAALSYAAWNCLWKRWFEVQNR